MSILLDANLADWTADDRLETPETIVAGYELYGRYEDEIFYFALQSAVAIGPNTTLWLNTDGDTASGYQIWGFAGGAEFSVNFDAGGVPRLYTGANLDVLVGDVGYALSADGLTLELALPKSALGASVTSVGILADINDSVFLPADYTFPAYTIVDPASLPSSSYDGLLDDWTQDQRLETPETSVAGYEIYGKVTDDDFVFALKSAVAIGANTTFWLNTDGDAGTGHQIWGFAGGAEYNVNIGADGIARLYTGADGQTFVAEIDHAIAPDGMSIEFAVSRTLLDPSVTAIDMLADINNSVYLPPSYSSGGYHLANDPPPTSTYDGLLDDWTQDQRLETAATAVDGYEIYGKVTNDDFVLALKSAVVIGANTTFWLNTDGDAATGHQIWGFAGGAEYNINIGADGIARLYTGADGQTFVAEIDHAIAPDGMSIELAISRALLGPSVTAINVLADVNNSVFLPSDYNSGGYALVDPGTLPTSSFDGLLDDWTQDQRLETPQTAVAGYEIYGKSTLQDFVFALKSAVEIGANTTFWLNTDADAATGYQIWGFAGGAEYNVNIGADGIARLYTGADGQTFVSEIDHKIAPDGMSIEFAVSRAILGPSVTSVALLADVNNSVFLPADYGSGGYTVADADPPNPAGIDGLLDEWTAAERLETTVSTVAGHEVYGKYGDGSFILALKSDQAIGPQTTFWLNTDGNEATGHQVFGFAGGAEYNVNIGADGIARLYSGAAGETFVANVAYAIGPDGKTIELALPKSLIGGDTVTSVSVLADVNETVFLPGDYQLTPYRITDPASMAQPEPGSKIAIVYSQTSEANYFSPMAYAQLVMAAQSQAMAAGVTFDLISEADLTNLDLLIDYEAIVFPSFRNVPANYQEIADVLTSVVYDYDVSLIAAGDFMTSDANGNALAGNAYERMELLFGITRVGGEGGVDAELVANGVSHEITAGYGDGGLIRTYEGTSTSYFTASNPGYAPATTIASQTVNGVDHPAILSTQTGGTNLHFASEAFLADNNLLGQAMDWLTDPATGPSVSLRMSREQAIMATRVDMDQSQEAFDVDGGIYDAMLPILEQWKQDYGFVGSYYINVGLYAPDQETNWLISAPYYQQLLAMGNEIGSHSYTHPSVTDLLLPDVVTQEILDDRIAKYAELLNNPSACFCPYCMREDADQAVIDTLAGMSVAEINATLQNALAAPDPMALDPVAKAILEASFKFQFETSRHTIESNLGIEVTGAAVPGMPETLETARQIIEYYDYLSGGAALVGAGYPGAMGYLSPSDGEKVYIAPNMSFDFTLTNWLGLTAEEALAQWQQEWDSLTINSDMPIIVWPWHDYGPTLWEVDPGQASPFSLDMFSTLIAQAYGAGAEFVTLADLAERIKAFEQASVGFTVNGDTIVAEAVLATGGLGTFALDLSDLDGKVIGSVANWYAYDADSVFLDADGGTFEIALGDAATDVTHIIDIAPRAKLMSLTGNGTDLNFVVEGEGQMVIDLKQTPGYGYEITGATVVGQQGDLLTIDLGAIGSHTVSVQQVALTNHAASDIEVSNLVAIAENTLERTKVADLAVVDPDTDPTFRNNVVTVSDDRFEIDPVDGALYLKAGQAVDFEAGATIELTLTATDGSLVYSEPLAITVGDVNEAPTDITAANVADLAENTAVRTKVADLSVVDPDLDPLFLANVLTVSDERFEIDASDMGLYLKAGQSVDFETASVIALTLTTTDGPLTYSRELAITVTNVNEAPTGAVTVSGAAVVGSELTAATDTLGDPDGLGALSYQWQRNTGSGYVNIAGAMAASYVLTEADAGASVRAVVSYVDGGGTSEAVISSEIGTVATSVPQTTLAAFVEDTTRIITPDELGAGAIAGSYTVSSLAASSGTLLSNPDGTWTFVPVENDDTSVLFTYVAETSSGVVQGTASLDLLPAVDIIGTQGADNLSGRSASDQYHGLAGNDIIVAGGGADVIFAGAGDDSAYGQNGRDTFIAVDSDGNDLYDGGGGVDALDLSRTSANAVVDLAAGTASSSAFGTDTLVSIEDVIGSRGNDIVTGKAGANVLDGGFGDDVLSGLGGRDTLIGGHGNDTLIGGAEGDFLTGGAGFDTFVFAAVSHSGTTASSMDVISDFVPGEDKLDLAAIDASTAAAGNQAFTFLEIGGTAFTGAAGQLRWWQDGVDSTFVAADVNGDAIADFQIELTGLINLTATDFIL